MTPVPFVTVPSSTVIDLTLIPGDAGLVTVNAPVPSLPAENTASSKSVQVVGAEAPFGSDVQLVSTVFHVPVGTPAPPAPGVAPSVSQYLIAAVTLPVSDAEIASASK